VSPASLSFLANEGQLRTSALTLRNSSSGATLDYGVDDDASWVWVVPASGRVVGHGPRVPTLTLPVKLPRRSLFRSKCWATVEFNSHPD
jgi:hypothetical protein